MDSVIGANGYANEIAGRGVGIHHTYVRSARRIDLTCLVEILADSSYRMLPVSVQWMRASFNKVVFLRKSADVVNRDEDAQVPFGWVMIQSVVGVIIVGKIIKRGGGLHFLECQSLLRHINRQCALGKTSTVQTLLTFFNHSRARVHDLSTTCDGRHERDCRKEM